MAELNENFITLSKYPVLMLRRDGEAIPVRKEELGGYLFHPVLEEIDSDEFKWFAKYTNDPKTIQLIKEIKKSDNEALLPELQERVANEFCRVRFGVSPEDYMDSDYLDNQEIVFRITSTDGFNWFDSIYSFVIDNRTQLKYISVVKEDFDAVATSHKPYKWNRIQNSLEIPLEDFLQSDARLFN